MTGGKGPILGADVSSFYHEQLHFGSLYFGNFRSLFLRPFEILKFETNLHKVTAGSVEATLAQICCNNGGALGR